MGSPPEFPTNGLKKTPIVRSRKIQFPKNLAAETDEVCKMTNVPNLVEEGKKIWNTR